MVSARKQAQGRPSDGEILASVVSEIGLKFAQLACTAQVACRAAHQDENVTGSGIASMVSCMPLLHFTW